MHQGKEEEADGGGPGPAPGQQQLVQGGKGQLRQAFAGHVGHDHHRYHDLVGGQAQDEGQQYHAVQPQQAGEGVEKGGKVGQQR